MRGRVRRVRNGIPAAVRALPEAKDKVIDSLTLKLLRDAKANIRDLKLIDTGLMRNSGYAETTRWQSARQAAIQAALAAGAGPGRKSRRANIPERWAAPSRKAGEGEGKVAFAAEYSVYWELGWGRGGATFYAPFLGPAAETLRSEAPAIVDKLYKNMLAEALGRGRA
jgi:hypothetical protein